MTKLHYFPYLVNRRSYKVAQNDHKNGFTSDVLNQATLKCLENTFFLSGAWGGGGVGRRIGVCVLYDEVSKVSIS